MPSRESAACGGRGDSLGCLLESSAAMSTHERQALLSVRELKLYFPIRGGIGIGRPTRYFKAVDGISFDVIRGETLGLVGESGCGKTTAGRAILQLYRPTSGEVVFRGEDLVQQSPDEIRQARRYMQ